MQTVASAGALQFVGAATLEGLTGRPPFTDLYEAGRAMDHIHLARWADAAIVCPATANSLNRLAAGLADDAVGALFLAWELAAQALADRARDECDDVGSPGDARARASGLPSSARACCRSATAGSPAAKPAKAACSRSPRSRDDVLQALETPA